MTMPEPVLKKVFDDDFIRFVGSASGLIWWMKTGDKEIVFFNDGAADSRDKQAIDKKNLLLDLVWAQQIVVEEDFFRFKFYIQSMRQRREATAVFRLHDNQGRLLWWRIAGAPGLETPSRYYGFIHDISENVSLINHLLEKDLARQTMIETDEHPVLLVDMESKRIISCNTPACGLLGFSYQEFQQVNFLEIFAPEHRQLAAKIYETCLLEGNWLGKIEILNKGGDTLEVRAKIKRLCLRERNMLRISIVESPLKSGMVPGKPGGELPDKEQFGLSLAAAMEDLKDMHHIDEVLDVLLDRRFNESLFEAIMYADINIKKGMADIYARGEAFKTLNPGTSYNYEGAIAQLFRDNRKDFAILGDTLESTKPIDWALFIPFGIRSYLVKPFFHGGKLRSLLILCSTEADRFAETDMELYEAYFTAFLKGLRQWRKSKRK